MNVVEVNGATGWFDTNYEGKRTDRGVADAGGRRRPLLIHVEATEQDDTPATSTKRSLTTLERWDERILSGLVEGLDTMGPWRMLLYPTTPRRSG